MHTTFEYIDFVKKQGIALSEINPGSDEFALKLDHGLQAVDLLLGTGTPILGGDILCKDSGKLSYTYDNWYCEKINSESQEDYVNRSYNTARNFMNEIRERKGKDHYVVIVI